MDLGLKDRVAVVTGGSSGIGLATARLMLAEGASVAICARGAERLEATHAELARTYGDRVLARSCDVLDEDAVTGLRDAVLDRFGRVDMLINNAGRGRMTTFAETPDEVWRAELELKFFSIIRPTRAFLPALEVSGAGGIVVVSALLATQPEPHMVATAAARGGVNNLVKSLSREFAPKNIRINTILIGVVMSDQWRRRYDAGAAPGQSLTDWLDEQARARHVPLGRFGQPEEVARLVTFLASPAASYITGAQVDISGGQGRYV